MLAKKDGRLWLKSHHGVENPVIDHELITGFGALEKKSRLTRPRPWHAPGRWTMQAIAKRLAEASLLVPRQCINVDATFHNI